MNRHGRTEMRNKATQIEILRNRIRATGEAWHWCRANGRSAAAASRDMHAALAELKALTQVNAPKEPFMTTELRTNLINELAQEAAECAVDMAGQDQQTFLPSGNTALDFITNLRYEEERDDERIVLTRRELTQFHADYCRHLRNLSVPTEVAIARSYQK